MARLVLGFRCLGCCPRDVQEVCRAMAGAAGFHDEIGQIWADFQGTLL